MMGATLETELRRIRKDRKTAADAAWRQLIIDICGGVKIDPYAADAIVDDAGKSDDDLAQTRVWYEDRCKSEAGIAAALEAGEAAKDADAQLSALIEKRRTLVNPIDVEIATLTERRDTLRRQSFMADSYRQQLLRTRPAWIADKRAEVATPLEAKRQRLAWLRNEVDRFQAINDAARKELAAVQRDGKVVVDPRADAIARASQHERQTGVVGRQHEAEMRLRNSADVLATSREEIQSLKSDIEALAARLSVIDHLHLLPWPTEADIDSVAV